MGGLDKYVTLKIWSSSFFSCFLIFFAKHTGRISTRPIETISMLKRLLPSTDVPFAGLENIGLYFRVNPPPTKKLPKLRNGSEVLIWNDGRLIFETGCSNNSAVN